MMQRFIPLGIDKSIMRYEVYKNKNATREDFLAISDMYKRVMSEDKFLAIGAQENIKRGVFINGEMHSDYEKGALWFQSNVRDTVQAHFEKEVAAGHQIGVLEEPVVAKPAAKTEPEPLLLAEPAYKAIGVDTREMIAV